jgi:hypothetical protein
MYTLHEIVSNLTPEARLSGTPEFRAIVVRAGSPLAHGRLTWATVAQVCDWLAALGWQDREARLEEWGCLVVVRNEETTDFWPIFAVDYLRERDDTDVYEW